MTIVGFTAGLRIPETILAPILANRLCHDYGYHKHVVLFTLRSCQSESKNLAVSVGRDRSRDHSDAFLRSRALLCHLFFLSALYWLDIFDRL